MGLLGVVVWVLAACSSNGSAPAAVVGAPTTVPVSGRAPSNWQLAQTLPTRDDFPAEWTYRLDGSIVQSQSAVPPAPPQCGQQPRVFDVAGRDAEAITAEVNVPNLDPRVGSSALFRIWPVADGPALISEYSDWLEKCPAVDAATRNVDRQTVDGADAAIAVDEASAYTAYFAVRGVLVEVYTNLDGDNSERVTALGPGIVADITALPEQSEVAPGLAALAGDQLRELMPTKGSFPYDWLIDRDLSSSDSFGVRIGNWSSQRTTPPKCTEVLPMSGPHLVEAIQFAARPDDDDVWNDFPRLTLALARDFEPDLLSGAAELMDACPSFSVGSGVTERYTSVIVEDSRPKEGEQTFRFTFTKTVDGELDLTRSDYYSFVRVNGLVLSGNAVPGHHQLLDQLMADTVARMLRR